MIHAKWPVQLDHSDMLLQMITSTFLVQLGILTLVLLPHANYPHLSQVLHLNFFVGDLCRQWQQCCLMMDFHGTTFGISKEDTECVFSLISLRMLLQSSTKWYHKQILNRANRLPGVFCYCFLKENSMAFFGKRDSEKEYQTASNLVA